MHVYFSAAKPQDEGYGSLNTGRLFQIAYNFLIPH